jgi:hypothetical protein
VSDSIVGVWRLDSFESRDAEGAASYPMGERPRGLLIYTATGWMSVHVAHADRAAFASDDPLLATEVEQARAFVGAFIFYSGRYEVEGERVRHVVETSVHPNWTGATFERVFDFDGDRLILRTPPIGIGGTAISSELRWHRVG